MKPWKDHLTKHPMWLWRKMHSRSITKQQNSPARIWSSMELEPEWVWKFASFYLCVKTSYFLNSLPCFFVTHTHGPASTHSVTTHKPYAIFLTGTEIKPLNWKGNSILISDLKWSACELFSSDSPNGGMCDDTLMDRPCASHYWPSQTLFLTDLLEYVSSKCFEIY